MMSPILSSSQAGVVLATAMAVSGTVILLALRLHKSPNSHFPLILLSQPPSSDERKTKTEEKKKLKKKKKKKRVHFAEDVVDPIGNSDEYRKLHSSSKYLNPLKKSGGKLVVEETMPANRVALYNGILRDKVLHRVAYSC